MSFARQVISAAHKASPPPADEPINNIPELKESFIAILADQVADYFVSDILAIEEVLEEAVPIKILASYAEMTPSKLRTAILEAVEQFKGEQGLISELNDLLDLPDDQITRRYYEGEPGWAEGLGFLNAWEMIREMGVRAFIEESSPDASEPEKEAYTMLFDQVYNRPLPGPEAVRRNIRENLNYLDSKHTNWEQAQIPVSKLKDKPNLKQFPRLTLSQLGLMLGLDTTGLKTWLSEVAMQKKAADIQEELRVVRPPFKNQWIEFSLPKKFFENIKFFLTPFDRVGILITELDGLSREELQGKSFVEAINFGPVSTMRPLTRKDVEISDYPLLTTLGSEMLDRWHALGKSQGYYMIPPASQFVPESENKLYSGIYRQEIENLSQAPHRFKASIFINRQKQPVYLGSIYFGVTEFGRLCNLDLNKSLINTNHYLKNEIITRWHESRHKAGLTLEKGLAFGKAVEEKSPRFTTRTDMPLHVLADTLKDLKSEKKELSSWVFALPSPHTYLEKLDIDTMQYWFSLEDNARRSYDFLRGMMARLLQIALTSIYFMHAKGATLHDKSSGKIKRKPKKRKAKKKKARVPEVKYKTLDIGFDLKKTLQKAKEMGINFKRSLHICKGHMREYSTERPMKVFGKPYIPTENLLKGPCDEFPGCGHVAGRCPPRYQIWIPAHERGKESEGVVEKVYRPRTPNRYYRRNARRRKKTRAERAEEMLTSISSFQLRPETGLPVRLRSDLLSNQVNLPKNYQIPAELKEQLEHDIEGFLFQIEQHYDITQKEKHPELTEAEKLRESRFRQALLERDGICAVTGIYIPSILDGAHLFPLRNRYDNDPANGLLLRKDIHKLFDIDLIGIHPETYQVFVNPQLYETIYWELDGVPLQIDGAMLLPEALRWRWFNFLDQLRVTKRRLGLRRLF